MPDLYGSFALSHADELPALGGEMPQFRRFSTSRDGGLVSKVGTVRCNVSAASAWIRERSAGSERASESVLMEDAAEESALER